jgi:hypothetical protein
MKLIIFLTLLLVFPQVFNAQSTVKIYGIQFYKNITIGNEILQINGGGLREKYWIDLYVSALYLKEKSSDALKIIHGNEEMGMHFHIVSDKVTRDKFIKSLDEGFTNNATAGKSTKEELKKLGNILSDKIKIGDRIHLDYIPNKGIKVTKNDKFLGIIEGLEFKKALFSIWLGSKTVDESLKNKMLGK